LQELSRRELNKVLIQLQEAQMFITAPAMAEFLEDKMPELAKLAVALEITGLASTIKNPPRFNAPTAKMAYEAALQNPVQATGELLETMVRDWPARDALRVSNIVQKGWGQGKTLQQMVREVVGTKSANYADGVLDVSRRHASTVIHTSTQHVANAARMEVWERNGDIVEKYQWVSTLDRRTTQQCRSLDGRTFEPGKGPMPPIHPNCRSTTVAVLGPEWDFLDEGATRASSGPNPGYVSADLTYYDWLKTQPPEFQNVALGSTRAKLFRDGGLTPDAFAKLNLGRDFEALTLAEMRDIEPEAFKRAGL
jgi:SPP1 gp7 family putative phage head morphogenesis protein